MSYSVPFIRPVFPTAAEIGSDFDEIVESNWYTNFGPKERRFAEAIGDYVGDGLAAVTFSNATLALMAVLHGVLGPGDRTRSVLVPSFTFAAGPAAIEWIGYRPAFIDIDPTSLQPSVRSARAALDAGVDVAGILLCNTFGIGNPDIDDWLAFSRETGLPLVIDSAAGFGSQYGSGAKVGTAGIAEVFSFHATKPFAIGEGGAVVSRDAALLQRLHDFQNFGFSAGQGAAALGLNGKLQELNAAIGLRQLAGFDHALAARQQVLESYRAGLEGTGIVFPALIERSSVCFAAVLAPTAEARTETLSALEQAGVEARSYYSPAVHLQPHYSRAWHADVGATDDVVARVLSLPVHQQMSRADIDTVAGAVRSAAGL